MNLKKLSLAGMVAAIVAIAHPQSTHAMILLEPDPDASTSDLETFVRNRAQRIVSPDGKVVALLQPAIVVTPQRGTAAATVPAGVADGIVQLTLVFDGVGTFLCTGTLLPTRQHILTAAHCVTDEFGNVDVDSGSAQFPLAAGPVSIPFGIVKVHPAWDYDFLRGNDLAVITLAEPAPVAADSFDINRTQADLRGQTILMGGYGMGGVGTTGATLSAGTFRWGQNRIDAFADPLLQILGLSPNINFVPQSALLTDFDNGSRANDASGFWLSIRNRGVGTLESNIAPGDSGSSIQINNEVVGVASYGMTLFATDVDNAVNFSFGEFAGFTNVYLYRYWVDLVTGVS